MSTSPNQILGLAYRRASKNIKKPLVKDSGIRQKLEYVCSNLQNRAGVRLLLSCLLAKVHRPEVDIRKPYTEIGTPDSYSGRSYDETYLARFINKHRLPCNPTTAFLTPALRNRNIVLTPDVDLVGRPPELYKTVLELITDVHENRVLATYLLAEAVRCLVIIRDNRVKRMEMLLSEIKTSVGTTALSSEAIVTLIQQHLNCRGSSRLPVLVIAVAYKVAAEHLRERILALQAHTAADQQTKTLGDIEITLIDDDNIITSYEMKTRRVTREDIDRALQKIEQSKKRIDNYIFITTDIIETTVQEYATSVYELTGGIELVVLDCITFLRYFLHLFHRLRLNYLEAYQEFVLAETESAVSQPLKEAFLALRKAAESGE